MSFTAMTTRSYLQSVANRKIKDCRVLTLKREQNDRDDCSVPSLEVMLPDEVVIRSDQLMNTSKSRMTLASIATVARGELRTVQISSWGERGHKSMPTYLHTYFSNFSLSFFNTCCSKTLNTWIKSCIFSI